MNLSSVDWCKKDFDHIKWVNNLFQNRKELTLEECAANVVKELNTKKKETNIELSKISRNLYKNVPELMNEVIEVQKSVGQLRNEVNEMRQTIDEIEKKNAKFIRSLNAIESVKNRLENEKTNLEQIENWNSFEKDFGELLASGAFEQASRQLCDFRDSLDRCPDSRQSHRKQTSFAALRSNLIETVSVRFRDELFARKTDECSKKFDILIAQEANEKALAILETYYETKIFDESWQKYAKNYQEFCKYLAANWRSESDFLYSITCGSMPSELRANFLVKLIRQFITKSKPRIKNANDYTAALLLKNTLCKLLEQIGDCDRQSFLLLTRTLFEPLRIFFENWQTYETQQLEKLVLISELVETSGGGGGDRKNLLKIDFSRLNSAVTVNISMAFENAAKRLQDLSQFRAVSIILQAFDQFFSQTHRNFCTNILNGLQSQLVSGAANQTVQLPNDFWNSFQIPVHLLKHLANCLISLTECNSCLIQKIKNQIILDNEAQDPTYFILSKEQAKYWDSLAKKITDGQQNFDLFSHTKSYFAEICTKTFHMLIDVLSSVATAQFTLKNLTFLENRNDQETGFDVNQPQEYITAIGQYLLTLPQNLEPFFMRNDAQIIEALKLAEPKFAVVLNDSNFQASVILIVIETLAQKICNLFIDMIFDCPPLSAANCQQLVTDINYLRNVLEDLGLNLTDNLVDVEKLLDVPADRFLAATSDVSTKIVFTIKQIRGVMLVD